VRRQEMGIGLRWDHGIHCMSMLRCGVQGTGPFEGTSPWLGVGEGKSAAGRKGGFKFFGKEEKR